MCQIIRGADFLENIQYKEALLTEHIGEEEKTNKNIYAKCYYCEFVVM